MRAVPRKNGLEMLTPPISGRVWVQSAVASLMSMTLGILLLARGDWIPGGILVAAAIVGLTVQLPRLWQLYRERRGSSPPTAGQGH